jgi:hypothetical protein
VGCTFFGFGVDVFLSRNVLLGPEDDNSADYPAEKFSDGDQNFFLTFLQIAEVRLYKLVRWARNLPQFSAISVSIL